jgi:hypothetical protein
MRLLTHNPEVDGSNHPLPGPEAPFSNKRVFRPWSLSRAYRGDLCRGLSAGLRAVCGRSGSQSWVRGRAARPSSGRQPDDNVGEPGLGRQQRSVGCLSPRHCCIQTIAVNAGGDVEAGAGGAWPACLARPLHPPVGGSYNRPRSLG